MSKVTNQTMAMKLNYAFSDEAWAIVARCPDGVISCKDCKELSQCDEGKRVVGQMVSAKEFQEFCAEVLKRERG